MDATTLRNLYGPVSPLAQRKVMTRLDPHARHFIRLSPFLVIATGDLAGGSDASPRGDAPGFVQVLDDARLLIPDRPGNNRLDTYRNIAERPGVGLIFMVPGIGETLRINGDATVVTEAALLQDSAVQGKVPKAGLLVEVREVFLHCAKALKRSKLWEPESLVPRSSFPTLGRILADQTGACDAEEADRTIAEAYVSRLY